jgi:hypothetical protein
MGAIMLKKRILRSDRVRYPDGRFSFIPHRFLVGGFFNSLTQDELLLYFFLTLASDKNGVSYYGQKSICTHLDLQKNDYVKALNGLIQRDLIAFDGVFFQVMQLPEKPVALHHVDPVMLDDLCKNIGKGGAA